MPFSLLKRWKSLLQLLLIFLPAVFMARLVGHYAVDVGNWDMWENGELLGKWHNGTLSWHDLYAPQIQHRIVFPRLLIIALTHLSGGDFRWENYATYMLMLASAVLLYRLMTKTLGGGLAVAAIAFIANLMIFSPMLYQIYFWGSSLWMSIPVPCLLLILNIVAVPEAEGQPLPRGAWLKFAAAVLIAEVATHSFSHGLVFWPLIISYLLMQPTFATTKARMIMAGIALVIGAVTIKCYFTDFYNVAFHAYSLKPGDYALETGMNLADPADRQKFIGFFFGFLGNPFSRTPFEEHPLASAQALGVWVLVAFLVPAAAILFTTTGRRTWRRALPWLALACYVISVALAISKGRASIGEHRSVTTRYIEISLFLPASIMVLWALLIREWWAEKIASGSTCCGKLVHGHAIPMISALVLGALAMMQIPQWSYGMHLTRVWHQARRHSQALVLFLPHLKPASMKSLDKSYDYCLKQINTLNGLGLLKFKPLASPELKWFNKDKKSLPESQAAITEAKFLDDGSLLLRGNARFGQQRPADAVLITQGEKVIALGQPAPRPLLRIYGLDYEFANVDDVPVSEMYPWQTTIPAAQLPTAPGPLEFWALEVPGMRIARISTGLTVDSAARKAELK